MTPPMTGIKCVACLRVGSGGLRISKTITANTLATAALPIAATVGSKPRTTIFVNGKLKLKIRTPRPASTSPMGVDGTYVSQWRSFNSNHASRPNSPSVKWVNMNPLRS